MSDDPNNKTMLGIQPFRGDPWSGGDDDPVARMRAAQQKQRGDRPSMEELADLDWDVAVPDEGARAVSEPPPQSPAESVRHADGRDASAPPVAAAPEAEGAWVATSTSPYLSREYAAELDAVRDRFRQDQPILLDDELDADRDESPATQTAMFSAREIKAELDGEAPVQRVGEPAAPPPRKRAASGTMMLSGADLASALSEAPVASERAAATVRPAASGVGRPAASGVGRPAASGVGRPAASGVGRPAASGTVPLRGSDINAAIEAAAATATEDRPAGRATGPPPGSSRAPGAPLSEASAASAPVSTRGLPSHASGTLMLSGATVRAAFDELGAGDVAGDDNASANAPAEALRGESGADASTRDPAVGGIAGEAERTAGALTGDEVVEPTTADASGDSGHTPASDAVFAALESAPDPSAPAAATAAPEPAPSDRKRTQPSVNTIQQAAIDVDRAREIVRARHAAGRASLSDASTAMPGARIKRPGASTESTAAPPDTPPTPPRTTAPNGAGSPAPSAGGPATAPAPSAVAPPAPQPTDDELASLLASQAESTPEPAPAAPPSPSRNTSAIFAVGVATLGVLATIFFLLYWFVLR